MELDKQQLAAVKTADRQALVIAGPGAGKTRVIVERAAYLIEECKVSPYEIYIATFTRKAAREVRDRLVERVGPKAYRMTIGTFHATALDMLHRFGEFIGFRKAHSTVYGEFETQYLLRDVAKELGIYNGKAWKIPKKEVDGMFAAYYQTGAEPGQDEPLTPLFNAFIQRCKENNSYTYGSLLTGFKLLLPRISQYLQWKHLIIDEAHDTDMLQWTLIRMLQHYCKASLFIVADTDQCQPPGTMVKVLVSPKCGSKAAEFKWVDISELKNGDEILSWDKHDKRIYHVGRKIRVSNRKYSGRLLSIMSNGNTTRVTPDHWFWAKFNEKAKGQRVVYLMWRSDLGFRIGTTQLRRNGKWTGICLSLRCRLEKAERVWILRLCNDKIEAETWEQILALKYRIPYCTFEFNGTRPEKEIRRIFTEISAHTEALACLWDHGLKFDDPFQSWPSERHQKMHGYFKVKASNLIENIMDLPTQKINGSAPIDSIKSNYYQGPVYSLDVEKDHTYVADGIPVGNCIYEWRGACPEFIIDHQHEFRIYLLETNYRSVPEIVEASNNLISHNKDRIPKTMKAVRPA